ncbi:MAG: polysaccharide deacetylase family protein [Desulfobacteraceae bacterium]|nr:polysaccharide deacetylase family protein [Desulfobacteraceae bacterium]
MVRILLLLLAFLTMAVSNASAQVTAFIYHRVGDSRYPTTNVDTNRFREEMAYLLANKYQVLPLSQVVDALKEKKPLPERAVVLTFDDGYRSVYKNAWPVLKSFGYPFTVFLYTQATDSGWPDHMTWNQVREMRAAGVDFQDHGYGHLRFGTAPPGLDDQANRSRIRSDLIKSGRLMAQNLGEGPSYLALPYGEYNRTVLEEVKKLGYEAVFTQDPGAISAETDPYRIPREPIVGREWSTMDHFEMVLKRVDLPFTAMEPDIVPLATPVPQRFAVRLLHPERYQPNSLGIYVTELGWQKATLSGNVLSVPNRKPLTKRENRVAVSGREKESGRTAIRFWMLFKE